MKTESREERLANLKNAFRVATEKRAPLEGKSLWLIDDVATTGTTLEECALVLKQAGAKSVFGIVLAR
jgi:predicted amidophosphoribosyltransferase